jgi:two-component system KDP operon response regulator KdpE
MRSMEPTRGPEAGELGPAPNEVPSATVLVIEDEAPIRKFLRAGLEGEGYGLLESPNGRDGITQAATRSPDLVLLDLALPDVDGFQVVRRIREWSAMPIIVLSAHGRDADKVRALDAGADDYVTKPFSMPELLARLRVALRHRAIADASEAPSALDFGNVRVDFARRRVTSNGADVALTPTEYRLLALLARHPGRVLTREFLLREVWGRAFTNQHHYLRVYMAQLRHKLEADPARPRLLLTETGVGYRMTDAT